MVKTPDWHSFADRKATDQIKVDGGHRVQRCRSPSLTQVVRVLVLVLVRVKVSVKVLVFVLVRLTLTLA